MKNFVFVLFCLSLMSCAESKQEKITKLLDRWIGYEFKFPKSSVFTIQANDTVEISMLSDYKIVTYVDASGCTSCKLQLKKWKALMDTIDSIKGINVTFIYDLATPKILDVRSMLKAEKFIYPVCIDEKDSLNLLNKFPSLFELSKILISTSRTNK